MPYGKIGGRGGNGGASLTSVPSRIATPSFKEIKSISYNATESDKIFSVKSVISSQGDSAKAMPSVIEVKNTGGTPLILMAGYANWTSETAVTEDSAGTFAAVDIRYLHTLVMPGESFNPPTRGVLTSGGAITDIMDGTAVTNAVPNSNMYADISTVSSGFDNTTDPVTFASADGDFWRVGDMIRSNAEVAEITAISGANLTVKRAMLGTSAASHGDGETLRLQFSNDYYDIDKYSVVQTDSDGKYKASNFFGIGRTASGVQGLIPGSISFKFYNPGYQSLGLSGLKPSTPTGLVAGRTYYIKINCDSAGVKELSFTVDGSNTNLGGSLGVIQKLQTAIDDEYHVPTSELFEKTVTVSIVDGDLRFTSGQRLSTSSIALSAGTSGASTAYEIFGVANGRFPILADINDAVAARLPDDVIYDPITYVQSPNAKVFAYDNGYGEIHGTCQGEISYETGSLDLQNCPPNAEMVVSCLHSSAFSGKLNEGTGKRTNSLVEILANTTSQMWNGKAEVMAW